MFYCENTIFPTAGRAHYRIPSIVVTKRGTVLAFCNDRHDTVIDHADESSLVLCRKEAGGTWSEVITLADLPGWTHSIGSAVYDGETDTVFMYVSRRPLSVNEFGHYTPEQRAEMEALAEKRAKEAGLSLGAYWLVSLDDGKTWTEKPFVCTPTRMRMEDGTERSFTGFPHGSAPGVQLRHGEHAGRLLMPSRFMTGTYTTIDELQIYGFNNALYSDDHGQTWTSSVPVQAGTGEGTLIERQDGTILYNSRAYYHDQKRYLAVSRDGGETWGEFSTDPFLLEEKRIGCNAAFLRVERSELKDDSFLPPEADSVTLFANPRAENRSHMTICVSFESGKSWCHTKMIREGGAAYSALAYSREDGHFYLLYELGEKDPCQFGLNIAEFDGAWLMEKDEEAHG